MAEGKHAAGGRGWIHKRVYFSVSVQRISSDCTWGGVKEGN